MPFLPKTIVLTSEQEKELKRRVGSALTAQRDVERAQIILECAQGHQNRTIAEKLGINEHTVGSWRKRFAEEGLEGLQERKGRGRKPTIGSTQRAQIIDKALKNPPQGQGRWSCRTMARHCGVSKATVQRHWKNAGIKPHITRTFKLSKDPQFEEKFWDVVGLYLNPPEQAIVLSCDEKSQIQALERTQPGLPLGLGHIATQTHDYYRHGTVTLFAALDYVSGKVITQTHERHRHQEWIKFLTAIDQQTPPDLALHIICDNYATHKHPKVKAWLGKHPRFHIHFTPTSSSWLNLVERFFRDLTQNAVREFSQPPHRGHDPGDGIRWPGVGAHAPSKFPIVYVTEGKAFSQQLNVAGATSYADATPPE
jgi:transposase